MAEIGELEVRDLRPDEVRAAIAVIGRGMRDNPLHVAAYGDDPERRRRATERLVGGLFRVSPAQEALCAVQDGTILGVTGVAPVATCRPTVGQRLRLLPTIMGLGPPTAGRVAKWFAAWAARDPAEDHVHLGPLAVDSHLQGRGIGSRIVEEHCRRLDAAGEVGYLETDKRENVPFYERHGFEVIGEESVLGVANWFMRREPL